MSEQEKMPRCRLLTQRNGAGSRTRLEQSDKRVLFFVFLFEEQKWCSIVNEVRTLIEEDLTSGEKVWFVYNRAQVQS